ncbi:MAG: DUF6263 family protein [Candidatus Glassbacteria bacterium]
MTYLTKRLALLFAASLLGAGLLGGAQKVNLRLNLEKGRTYHLRTTSDQKTSQTMQGREMNMQQKTVDDMAFTVNAVAGGDITLGILTERVEADIVTPRDTVHYDSSQPGEVKHPMLKALAAMAGQSLEMTVSTTGRIKSVSGMDRVIDRIIASLEMPEGPAREALISAIRKNFGEEAFKDQWGFTFAAYPDRPVAPGDTWKANFVTGGGFPIIYDGTWTLSKIEGGAAVVAVDARLSTNTEAPPFEMGPLKVKMEITGTQTGTLRIDLATGWITGGSLVQKFEGTNRVESGPGQTSGMTWPMKMETVTSFENF